MILLMLFVVMGNNFVLHLYHLCSRKNIENMKINRLIFTLGMMAICVTAHGQTSTISGVLLDSLTHEGEPYATIRVYKGKKSETPVAMSVTAEDGKFSQKVTGQGSYIVSFTSMGRKEILRRVQLTEAGGTIDLGNLLVQDDTKQLKGVEVVAQKPLVKMETDGKSFGVKCTDGETGELTLNLGKINLENNELEIWIDMRVPVKIKNEQIIETIKKNTEDFGYEFLLHSNTQPLYVAKDSFLVSTLMNIYKELTGDNDAEPVAIGGGTYAKYAKNAVAFGALLPDQEDRMHQRDEYLEISKIDKLLQIYVEAIYRLAK